MRAVADRFLARRSVFAWIALVACALLLIPLAAMQFTTEVDWDIADFAVMGVLLFVAGSAFVLAARRVSARYRPWAGVLVLAALLYVWAELAVGIFTNLGH